MPSHAEKNQTEIENYYHIIDPEGRLSENERAKEENKVLANMPACFPEALRIYARGAGLCIKGIRVNDWSLQKWKG